MGQSPTVIIFFSCFNSFVFTIFGHQMSLILSRALVGLYIPTPLKLDLDTFNELVLKLYCASESPEGFVKTNCQTPAQCTDD